MLDGIKAGAKRAASRFFGSKPAEKAKQQPTKQQTIRVGIQQPDGSIKTVEMPVAEAMRFLNPPGWY